MEIEFKKIFKLVDNGNLTYNLHSLCYQNNILISEFDLGDVEGILVQLKKQKEIIDKTKEYIKNNNVEILKYYDEPNETSSYEVVTVDVLKLLEDKEVQE